MEFFKNRKCLIATMHQKERVIAPILENTLKLKCFTSKDLDTDRFGTFSREIPRRKNQYKTLEAKIDYARKLTGENLIIANEGSFSPDPRIPFITLNIEMIMLKDFENGFNFTYAYASNETNFGRKQIGVAEEGIEFAIRNGFPNHGVIIYRERRFRKPEVIAKGINNENLLWEILLSELKHGKVFIETDLRAMYNPTRMKNIEMTTVNFTKEMHKICPLCKTPGFSSDLIMSHRYNTENNFKTAICQKCGLQVVI